MIVQAKNARWDRKLRECKNLHERNKLIMNSGTYRCATLWDFKNKREFFRPAVGNFIIHGLTEHDNFRYDTEYEAIEKGEEMYQILVTELTHKEDGN